MQKGGRGVYVCLSELVWLLTYNFPSVEQYKKL